MGVSSFIPLLLTTVFCELASAEKCVYHHVLANDTYVSCAYGCCYTYIYPCCFDSFVDTDGFKVLIACSVCASIFMAAGLAFVLYKARQRSQAQAGVTVTPVFAPALVTVPSGYVNSSFPTQPMPNNPNYKIDPPQYSSLGGAPPPYRQQE